MWHFEVLIAFMFASVGLTLAPGPDILYVLSLSLNSGWKKGFMTALGLVSGLIFHTMAVALGVGYIIERYSSLIIVIKILGALYLLFLAYQMWTQKSIQSMKKENKKHFKEHFKTGLVMNLINPKVSLFFLGFFPAFQFHDTWHMSTQFLFLGFLFLLQALVIFFSVAFFSAALGQSFSRVKDRINWNKIQSILLFSIAILLFLS